MIYQLATIDEMDHPNIQPVWASMTRTKKALHFDRQNGKEDSEHSHLH
jgi:hypothetical protein